MSRFTDGRFIVRYSEAKSVIEGIFSTEEFGFKSTTNNVRMAGNNVIECTYKLNDEIMEDNTYTFTLQEGYESYEGMWRQNEMRVSWENDRDFQNNRESVQNLKQLEIYLQKKMPKREKRLINKLILVMLRRTDQILSPEANKEWIDSIKAKIKPLKDDIETHQIPKKQLTERIRQKMENLTSEIVSCLG